jgi:hypothetical protein
MVIKTTVVIEEKKGGFTEIGAIGKEKKSEKEKNWRERDLAKRREGR